MGWENNLYHVAQLVMSDNPYESSQAAGMSEETNLLSPLVKYGALVVVVGGLIVALLIPAPRSAREAGRRNQCLSNLKQIGLALHTYHDEHGAFPPAYTVDADGNRLHSWRTLLLPYLDQQALFESIDLTKPWDDPVNAEARETVLWAYVCPSSPDESKYSNYLAVIGPEHLFFDSTPRKKTDVTDGFAKTIALVDVVTTREPGVHWMSPQDTTLDVVLAYNAESRMNHPGIFLALFLDGHVAGISTDSDQERRRAMLTIAGGEDLEL